MQFNRIWRQKLGENARCVQTTQINSVGVMIGIRQTPAKILGKFVRTHYCEKVTHILSANSHGAMPSEGGGFRILNNMANAAREARDSAATNLGRNHYKFRTKTEG